MIIETLIGILICAIIFIDIKHKQEIPAFLSTTVLILSLISNPGNYLMTLLGIAFGMLYLELSLFDGMADLKLFIALATFTQSLLDFAFFACLFAGLGLGYKLLIYLKIKHNKNIAFTPVFLLAYIGVLLI